MPQWYEKQLGPLPLGIWVGVVVVGAGASFLVNRKTKATPASTAPVAAGAGVSDATSGAFGSLPAGVNLGGVVALPGGVPAGQIAYTNPNSPISITDNNGWLRSATDQLIAKGYDPGLVDSSLRAYLNGYTPTASQQAIVNLALIALGAPPQPVLTLPTPTPTPTPVTPAQNYGPVYPQQADGQFPPGMICPPQAPILKQGATGYTCVTREQEKILNAYLGIG